MATTTLEWIKEGTNEIFTKTWKPASEPIATLVMIHGFGEHINRYNRMFEVFTSHGIECYGYDQRGWGETGKKSGQFGNNQGYNTALKDIDDAVLRTKKENVPHFLMGHSMGGGLVLNYLARGDTYKGVKLLTGAIASASLITLSMPIPALKYYSLRLISMVLPSITIQANVDPKGISHDENEIQAYINDPLLHDYATLATLRSFIDAGADILKTKAKLIKTPILYSHGDADPINAYKGTAEAYALTVSQDKELKTWPGLYHELHNETVPERDQVCQYYIEWIKKRCHQK
ncbi:Alpha/Beta hydrolase protein [Gilbertella persicaria]|uniref:Alpha/Beta hydrolase protein n=1 Tax=Gilbertella persicaria TaxID=101096 RepID=UPI002220AEBE|nr:Alpha/Beta hydrolase protein [Gilbertella persicaria]KAI8077908.1 Alpha/Beta hydrolase protein [Gilbertella persicaria]